MGDSTQCLMITALRDSLELVGFKVFSGILDHHTGFRTRTRSYIEIARSIVRTSNNITQGTIAGPFTLRLKYYQHRAWVTNSNNERVSLGDNLQLMEKAFSQVIVNGMYTPFDTQVDESAAKMSTGFTTNYILSGNLATRQDRGEVPDQNTWDILGSTGITWDSLNTTTWDQLEATA